MGYLLGIDGGGTHTTAWLADQALSVLARVQVGPSNPIKVGIAIAQRELAKAYREALREAGLSPPALDAVCAGLAGSDSPSVHKSLVRWIRKAMPARAALITTDAAITLAAALGDSEGIVVIAGTGSIAFARDHQGGILRVGGWGSQFDDAGSGYDIGRKAVLAALRAYDGRGKHTSLTQALCAELNLSRITEAVPMDLSAQQTASLFPVVERQATAGDTVARGLCRDAAGHLAELATSILSRLGWRRRPVPVVCSGGIFRSSALIRRSFSKRVHEFAPKAKVTLLRHEPVEGALILARQLIRPRSSEAR